ncbi:phytanoyl-CoA dioxygenase family protein [Candidatus Rhodobacter oscarellae]|uniref:phytanoyl-CoA dioxygenase family protein n=1 Tax=Candidatus Rhodobacter oscarellae TaxID=1675527 RepID=UPI000B1DD105|nr:phytanoyl-CoA dioxygenase family protein [Candidatus Rhodobacter lobularis]
MSDLLTDSPWSSVWRGTDPTGFKVVVKHRKREITSAPDAFPAIADVLGTAVPALIKHDPETRTTILAHVAVADGNARATRAEILSAYAESQVAASNNLSRLSQLPVFDPAECLALVNRLAADPNAVPEGLHHSRGNLFRFVQEDARNAIRATLEACSEKILAKTRGLDQARLTLEHTDLNVGNVLLAQGHRPTFIDWDDAVLAPPGLSLHMLFSGAARVAATLLQPGAYKDNAIAQSDAHDLQIYMSKLARIPEFSREFLLESLPVMAVFGTLKYCYDMSFYDLTNDGLGSVVAREATRKFSSLSQACKIMFPASPMTRTQKDPPQRNADCPFVNIKKRPSRAAARFREHGALHVRGAFSVEHIISAFKEVAQSGSKFSADIRAGRALRVGDRRYMLSLDTAGVIGQPETLASPRLVTLMRELLGADCILGSATSVMSLDGSDAQQWHRDNDVLFPEMPSLEVPSYSIAVLLPLVPLNKQNGSTEMVLGSHRTGATEPEIQSRTFPDTKIGDCYLMDCRLLHRGMANNSATARPVISLVYQKPWYRDYQNFNLQSALNISADTLSKFPVEDQPLVRWACGETP